MVPSTQTVKVTFQPEVDNTVVGPFCMDPEGEYEIRVKGLDLSEPIKINEVGSESPLRDKSSQEMLRYLLFEMFSLLFEFVLLLLEFKILLSNATFII